MPLSCIDYVPASFWPQIPLDAQASFTEENLPWLDTQAKRSTGDFQAKRSTGDFLVAQLRLEPPRVARGLPCQLALYPH